MLEGTTLGRGEYLRDNRGPRIGAIGARILLHREEGRRREGGFYQGRQALRAPSLPAAPAGWAERIACRAGLSEEPAGLG